METVELQKHFFQFLKSKIPDHVSFVEEIADLLEISTDSSYRRIRGEKPISFEEIQKLCRKFQISIDQILSLDTNSTVFYGQWLNSENFDFEKYLKDMHLQLATILGADSKIMYYEAKDIPPFHHFQFTELANFKYFFWMKTILSYPDFSKTHYEESNLKEPITKTGSEIIKTYIKIPSVEIWSDETINSTIHQIEFYKDSGIFRKKESIEVIYRDLLSLVNHIEQQAETGVKFLHGQSPNGNEENFNLYFNEVFLGHNTILVDAGISKTVFINHGVLNYMITRDKNFCDATKKSFDNTMRKSSLISNVNEKERHRFFDLLRKKIEAKIN